MMRPNAKVETVHLYPKPVDFRKSIDGLAALVELDIKVAVFDPELYVFLNKPRNRVMELEGWRDTLEASAFGAAICRPDIATTVLRNLTITAVVQLSSSVSLSSF